ncbi:MAG: hypothetical protein ACI9HE_003904, partial [Planctomycetota bacterium]
MPPHFEPDHTEPPLPHSGSSATTSSAAICSAGRGIAFGLGLFLVLAQVRTWLGQPLADSPLPQLTALSDHWFPGLLGFELLVAACSARSLWLRGTGLLLLALAAVHVLSEPFHGLRALVLAALGLLLLAPRKPAPMLWPAAIGALLIGAPAWPLLLILEASALGPKAGQPGFDAV